MIFTKNFPKNIHGVTKKFMRLIYKNFQII